MSDKEYIKHLKQENDELKKRVEELERLIKQNSKNSSKPPSSDFGRNSKPNKSVKKKTGRRKQGAQKGHKANLKQLVPEEQVTKFEHLVPEQCTCGCFDLEESQEPALRFQTFDLPPIIPIVKEYVQHYKQCRNCGEIVYKPLADSIRRNVFGPGVLAVVGVMTGMLNTSKRKALEVINEVFRVPMSLGGLSNCEAKISEAMADPYDDLKNYIQSQDTAHADESSWSRGNRLKGWLWAMACATGAFFMIHANRTQEAAREELLGRLVRRLVKD
ncbi:DUF6444 domain-containing protein [Planctomycetota bacterium]